MMNIEDNDNTNDSAPNGDYQQVNNIETKPSDEETQGIVPEAERGLNIRVDERTSKSSFSLVIDVAKEEEGRLFQTLNKRMKKLNR